MKLVYAQVMETASQGTLKLVKWNVDVTLHVHLLYNKNTPVKQESIQNSEQKNARWTIGQMFCAQILAMKEANVDENLALYFLEFNISYRILWNSLVFLFKGETHKAL